MFGTAINQDSDEEEDVQFTVNLGGYSIIENVIISFIDYIGEIKTNKPAIAIIVPTEVVKDQAVEVEKIEMEAKGKMCLKVI